MREQSYEFIGRGKGSNADARVIECTRGTVLAVVYSYGGVEFAVMHCRRAMIDAWGVYIADPFRCASNAALTRTWAEPVPNGIFIYRPARLDLVKEQDWMTRTE